MLQIIRNNSPYTVIILLIFTLVVKLQALSHPVAPAISEHHILAAYIVQLLNVVFKANAFVYTLFTVLMLFGQAIYLNASFVKNKLIDKPSYAVAFVYIILTSVFPAFNYFSEAVLLNWCLIAGVDFLLSFYQHNQPRKHIYNAGFILGVAPLLEFQSTVYLILLFAALLFLRVFNIAEWLVAIMGFLTPIYMYGCIVFLADKWDELNNWMQIGFSLPTQIPNPVYLIGCIIGILSLFIGGVYAAQNSIYKAGIYNRRMWMTVYIYLVLSCITAVGTNISEKSAWLLTVPALSLIIAPALIIEKTKWFSNFVFYFSLLLVIYCQWLVN